VWHFFYYDVLVHSAPDPDRDHAHDSDPDNEPDNGHDHGHDSNPDRAHAQDPDHDRDRDPDHDRDNDPDPDRHFCFAERIYFTTPKDSILAVWIYKRGQTGCAFFHSLSVNAPVS